MSGTAAVPVPAAAAPAPSASSPRDCLACRVIGSGVCLGASGYLVHVARTLQPPAPAAHGTPAAAARALARHRATLHVAAAMCAGLGVYRAFLL